MPISWSIVMFLLIAFVGSVVSGVLWFWGVPIVLAFSSEIFDIKKIIVFMSIYVLAWNTSKAVVFFKFVDWKLSLKLLSISLPFTIFGAYYMIIAPIEIIKIVLWIFLIIFSINKLFSIIKIKKVWNVGIFILSSIFWFIDGVIWAWWPVIGIMLSYMNLSKEKFVVMIAIPSIALSLIKIGIYWSEWFFKKEDIHIIIWLIIIAFVWTYVSKYVFKFIKPAVFEKIVLVLLMIMWVKLLFS